MDNAKDITKNLSIQIEKLETNFANASSRFKGVELYVNKRFKRLKKLLPLIEKSKNWTIRFSGVIDLFADIERVLEKMEELEGMATIREVPLDEGTLSTEQDSTEQEVLDND